MIWAGHVAYGSFLDQILECLWDNSVGSDKIMVPKFYFSVNTFLKNSEVENVHLKLYSLFMFPFTLCAHLLDLFHPSQINLQSVS